MISLKKRNEGFTIVELLIVIVVIGILAGLVITTYNGIQQKARNTERQTDINAIQSQLEAFYAQNGYYPFLANVNDAAWRSTNKFTVDEGALQDPKGDTAALAAAATTDQYGYTVTCSDPTTESTCTSYSLEADLEGTTDDYVKDSLN
jgi:general secretion pathway protein G